MKCSMCEQDVEAAPYKLIDTIPHHNGHTQMICEACKNFIGCMNEGGNQVINMSEDYKKNPLQVKKCKH